MIGLNGPDPTASDSDPMVIVEFGTSVQNGGPPVGWYAVGRPEFVGRAKKWWYDGNINSPPPVPTTRQSR